MLISRVNIARTIAERNKEEPNGDDADYVFVKMGITVFLFWYFVEDLHASFTPFEEAHHIRSF